MSLVSSRSSAPLISGTLLVSGTCIGAGMLAMPVVTASMGFYPALCINLLCCLLMMATGLLFLEATLWMETGANVLFMAERFLGKYGKILGGASFVFLYYCLLIGYFDAAEPLFVRIIGALSGLNLDGELGYGLFCLVFGAIVYTGAGAIDRVNWLLMTGLVLSYLGLLAAGSSELQAANLSKANWSLTIFAAPTLFSAYGYHNVVPSLVLYLRKNIWALRWSVIIGSVLPFVVYTLWQLMLLGSVPQEILETSYQEGQAVTTALITLQDITGSSWVTWWGLFFSFFALITSMLGVSLSMVDFFADGLHVGRKGLTRLALCLLVFLPSMLFAVIRPGLFLNAMAYAGGFGEAILNSLLPVAMVWIGRYKMGLQSEVRLVGGKTSLLLIVLLTVCVVLIEFRHALGW